MIIVQAQPLGSGPAAQQSFVGNIKYRAIDEDLVARVNRVAHSAFLSSPRWVSVLNRSLCPRQKPSGIVAYPNLGGDPVSDFWSRSPRA
jgi:hypothetical protein